ncbi:ubiquitin carboxyl-terminal hydrolase 47 isoform X1 [Octopus sinensis]|uniref:Ubiquitin carboxyl-terminal hydrolase 47 n=2 Tax=Octopus sinensis TaxID=2607531 RepID=A0A6P7SX97_9MOLL|nr:ubiquitin carboxyl-terminal hydrolase 47 isoform X1 [Octopus sinensis]
MVTGDNRQLLPADDVCMATNNTIVCIIRDLVDKKNPRKKRKFYLPASKKVADMIQEVADTCGYNANTISMNYEKPSVSGYYDVKGILDKNSTQTLGSLYNEDLCNDDFCNDDIQILNFTIYKSEKQTAMQATTEGCSNISLIIQKQETSEAPTTHGCETQDHVGSEVSPNYSCEVKEEIQASSIDHSYYLSHHKSETGFVGLVNQAMTCYLNSLLQTLFMTPEFRNALYRWEFTGSKEEAVKSIPYQLQKLFLTLQTSCKRAIETTDLTLSFGWDSSEVWHQHDVQELCRVMFDALEQNWKQTDQAHLINHLYQGKLKDYVKCLQCSHESARIDAYLDIPLVIRPFGGSQVYGSVEDALAAFVQPETLAGSNQYFCEKCGRKCDAHKGLKFVSFPYLLTLQLKRFDFDCNTMHRIKLNHRMTFPEVLDINHMIEEVDCNLSHSEGPLVEDIRHQAIKTMETNEHSQLGGDMSDEAIDEGIEIESSTTATLTNSESSSLSSESATNDRNSKESDAKGPYVYELFSIMIHSGSAAGGHYYAYIKSFKDGQWYSFNDQHVSKITYDDIRKTYGGSNTGRTYYSASYTSSTNAYMLMYRQIDKERNADFVSPEDFPPHMKAQLEELRSREENERKQQEIDKCTCKIKVFCYKPGTQVKMENKLEVHKDKTLRETTEIAYNLFQLKDVASLDCCRLVKYDDYCEALEKSFENEEDSPIEKLLGGVKSTYTFDLLLEIRRPDQTFQEYKPGGVTIKVHLVDLESEIIHSPVTVRACNSNTVAEFKELVAKTLNVPVTHMRCCLELYSDLRLLTSPEETLKSENFFRCNKVFIEYSGSEDSDVTFTRSKFYKLLDRHQNTIRIYMNIPSKMQVGDYKNHANYLPFSKNNSATSNGDDSPGSPVKNFKNDYRKEEYTRDVISCCDDNSAYPAAVIGADGASGPHEIDGTTPIIRSNTDFSNTSSTTKSKTYLPLTTGSNIIHTKMQQLNFRLSKTGYTQSDSGNVVSYCTDDIASPSTGRESMDESPLNSPIVDSMPVISPLTPNYRDDNSEDINNCNKFSSDITGWCTIPIPLGNMIMDDWASEISQSNIDVIGPDRARRGGEEDLVANDALNLESLEENCELNTSIQCEKDTDSICNHECIDKELDNEEYRHYFEATENTDALGQRTLIVNVDKRITLEDFKKELEPYIGLSSENFKVFKVYSNNQEFESTQLNENLSFLEDGKLNIKLGRALRPGEYRVKVYQLLVDEPEPCKFLIETIFAKRMSVLESKKQILAELKEQCNLDIPLSRCRLRKKSWKNPGAVYLDNQLYDDDISLYTHWEIFLEVLEGPDQVKSANELSLFARRWRTSTYRLDPFQEVVLSQHTTDHLREKLHEISGIEKENIEFAKARGTFPCDIPVLGIQTELDWNPQVTSFNMWPQAMCEPGSVIYYRDKTEDLMELSKEKKEELSQKENRVTNLVHKISNSPRKERALKIYTEDLKSTRLLPSPVVPSAAGAASGLD